jgi:hypothetical protein
MLSRLIGGRFLYTFRLGVWLIQHVLVPLDVTLTNIYFGAQGKCSFCGEPCISHHLEQRAEMLARLDALRDDTTRAAMAHKFEREHAGCGTQVAHPKTTKGE